jgi:hypothetical protein
VRVPGGGSSLSQEGETGADRWLAHAEEQRETPMTEEVGDMAEADRTNAMGLAALRQSAELTQVELATPPLLLAKAQVSRPIEYSSGTRYSPTSIALNFGLPL